MCARLFPNEKSLEIHEIEVHKKSKSKHILEKDPSSRNHKKTRSSCNEEKKTHKQKEEQMNIICTTSGPSFILLSH